MARDTAFENNVIQGVITTVVVVACVLTIYPRGTQGTGLTVVVLVLVNCLVLATRFLPSGAVPPDPLYGIYLLGAGSSAAIMAVPHSGAVSVFAFVLSGQAGYRLAMRRAITVAATTSVLCAGVLLLHIGPGYHSSEWYLGALSGATVLVGISNRSRHDAVRSAHEAAAQAELVAQSRAREHTLAERGRIARDVHDVLAHSLAAVNLQLEVADALMDAGDVAPAQQATRRAQSLVRSGLSEVQRAVTSIREDALPLVETLRTMLASTTGDTGTLEVVGTVADLDVRTSQTLVRCAQEALTNAAKYAPEGPVRSTVTYVDTNDEAGTDDGTDIRARARLDVVNGPARSDARRPAPTGGGMGLVGMRERVALIGGSVRAGPVVDGPDRGGWLVSVTLAARAQPALHTEGVGA